MKDSFQNSTNIIFCLVFFLIISIVKVDSKRNYIFVATHFRHGARTPLLDEGGYDKFKYPWELKGELTKVGQRMHYLLGLRNRQRYMIDGNLLNKTYKATEISVMSTDFNRTIMSALAQLQGLYADGDREQDSLNDAQKEKAVPLVSIDEIDGVNITSIKLADKAMPNGMEIVPVHIYRNEERMLLTFENDPCQNETRKNENEQSDKMKGIIKDFNDRYKDALNNMTNKSETYTIKSANEICDTYFVDEADGKKDMLLFNNPIYPVDEKIFKENCTNIIGAAIQEWVFGDKEKIQATIEGSKMFRRILELMQYQVDKDMGNISKDEQQKKKYNPKLFMISAHDSTVGGAQVFLIKAFDMKDEDYRSALYSTQLAFECYRESSSGEGLTYDDYKVDYMFNDDLIKSYKFSEFRERILKASWDDDKIDDYCGVSTQNITINPKYTEKKNDHKKAYIATICVLGALLLCAIIGIIILIFKNSALQRMRVQQPYPELSTTKE